MKAIGNTLHSVARSVRHQAQHLRQALPERNLVNETLQGLRTRLRGHRPVEMEGQMDPQVLHSHPTFEAIKTELQNALPEQHYNRDERNSLILNSRGGGRLLKESIEQRIGALRSAVEAFPVPGADAVTEQDERDASISLNAVKEQLQGLEDLMLQAGKGISANRKAHVRESIDLMKGALERAASTFPNLEGSWSRTGTSTTSEDGSDSSSS